MKKQLAKLWMRITGWEVTGGLPAHVKKCVMVAAPHTSNFDIVYTLATFFMLDTPLNYTIKQEWLSRFLIGPLLKSTGAIGVNREKTTNLVDSLADLFNHTDHLVLLIPPEGTRDYRKKWKTGFYYAALKAKVPIVLSYLDYKKKIGCIGVCFMPTGDFEKDMEILKEFYRDVTPRYPENFCLDIY